MTEQTVSGKLSIFKLKDHNGNGRKSVVTIDSKYEFRAPKYFDFSKPEEHFHIEDVIDPWFFIEHRINQLQRSRQSEIQKTSENVSSNASLKENVINKSNIEINETQAQNNYNIDERIKFHNEKVKKRKYSQFEKENFPCETNNNIQQTKKPKVSARTKTKEQIVKPLRNINSNDLINNKFAITKTAKKGDIDNSRENLNKTNKKVNQPRVNRFDCNVNNISKRAQTASSDNYSFKSQAIQTKNKNVSTTASFGSKSTSSNGFNKSKGSQSVSSSLQYCPRIHSSQVMKKWESLKGIKWYELSPKSRHEANGEISEMVKNKFI